MFAHRGEHGKAVTTGVWLGQGEKLNLVGLQQVIQKWLAQSLGKVWGAAYVLLRAQQDLRGR
jgi:hypothetical protein